MSARLIFLSWFFSVAPGMMSQELSLEQILEKYYRAGNFDRLGKVTSIIMTGTLVQQDLMPVKIIRVRPDKYMMEFDVADLTAYQVYDGQTAWMTAPWTGNPAPQLMPADRATDVRTRADMDGVLYGWKEKGHSLELAGKDTLNGHEIFRIKVVRKDGGTEYDFIDPSGFMLVKKISYRKSGNTEIPVENYYSDYRLVEGIPFAFSTVTNSPGRSSEIQLESVGLDKQVDLKIFKWPGK